jgi:hypothetical protein
MDSDVLLSMLDSTQDELLVKSARLEAEHLNVEYELEEFKKLAAIPAHDNDGVFKFWRKLEESGRFPVLCRVARCLLAIPASSSEVERIFSRAGLMITKKRSRLRLATIQILMFCNVNKFLLPVGLPGLGKKKK